MGKGRQPLGVRVLGDIARSRASGNRVPLFLFYLVVALVQLGAAIVGLILCCVGMLVTIPASRAVTDFGTTESFLLLTRGRAVTDYWEFWEIKVSQYS